MLQVQIKLLEGMINNNIYDTSHKGSTIIKSWCSLTCEQSNVRRFRFIILLYFLLVIILFYFLHLIKLVVEMEL
jgi:hypothetical protein